VGFSVRLNKLDAQSSKLNELEKKMNTAEQKLAKLDEKQTMQASMSNPANWDARKSTPAPAPTKKAEVPAQQKSRPEAEIILDPINEIND
jgi:hypothetical protein